MNHRGQAEPSDKSLNTSTGTTAVDPPAPQAARANRPWREITRRLTLTAPRRLDALGGLGSAALSLVGATLVTRLWRMDLEVPMLYGFDTLPSLMNVKNMQTAGWFQTTNLLNAPEGQDLAAHPASAGDLWNLLGTKALSTVFSPAATVNLSFILTFALIAVSAYVCLRLLGVTRLLSLSLGAVYSWLPYHFLRGELHLFLSNYSAIPVACVLAIRILSGTYQLGRASRRATWAALAAAALLGGTGMYYAAFSVVLVVAAGALGALALRSWRPLMTALASTIVTGFVVLLAASPSLLYIARHGSNDAVAGRSYGATEFYGLKLSYLLLPLSTHRLPALAEIRQRITDSPIPGEGSETLGLLGVIGIVIIIAVALMPVVAHRTPLAERLRPLGTLALVSIVCATVAGLNSVVAVLGFSMLRAWNRMSVVIAFLALAGLAMVITHLQRRVVHQGSPVRKWLPGAAALATAGLISVVGLLDQTSNSMVPDYASTKARWAEDSEYFSELQAELGSGSAVFQLPLVPFPENPQVVDMPDYEHLRGFLHSDLRWSYGGVKGSQGEWQAMAFENGTTAALPALVAAGFDAVYIDRRGYLDRGASIEAELRAATGERAMLESPDHSLVVYDLRQYAADLRASGTPLPSRDDVLRPVLLLFDSAAYAEEGSGTERWRWAPAHAQAWLLNPQDSARKVTLSGAVQVADASAHISVIIDGKSTSLRLVDGVAKFAIPVTAHPGKTTVAFETDSVATQAPGDARDLRQRLIALSVTPVE